MKPLLHYSSNPLTEVHDRAQSNNLSHKPKGLWLSVGNEWRKWCEYEQFHVEDTVHCTRVYLSDNADILRISNDQEIDVFSAQYQREEALSVYSNIDWQSVSEYYDGIIIAPYIWSRRFSANTMWYYTWDVASGCIWNSKAIRKLEPYKR
jgi:hypothetical protein